VEEELIVKAGLVVRACLVLRLFGFWFLCLAWVFIVGGLLGVWGVCYKDVFFGLFSWFCFVWRALWFGNVVVLGEKIVVG